MVDSKKYSGSGTFHGYHVEVRFKESSVPHEPQDCCGVIISRDWHRLLVEEVQWPLGVRNELWERDWHPHAFSRRLMTSQAAHAIAAHFAAVNRWNFISEFRFVEEKIEYNFTHSETRESEPFSMDAGLVPWVKEPTISKRDGG